MTCHLLPIAVISRHIADGKPARHAARPVTHTSDTHNHACHAGKKAAVAGVMFVYLRLPLSVSRQPLSGDNYCFTAISGAATFINAEHFRDREENNDIHVFMGIFSKQTP